ncbi:MAG: ATP synthase F1 subunit delta [Planctomycetia bacterium]|nr:ATP synthase F1 subunit delta [Planctomycetia bacterium]
MATDVQAKDARFAAELYDVNAEKIGKVYAEALFGVVDDDLSRVRELLGEFKEFIDDVLVVHPGFEKLLSSRLVGADEKIGVLDRVLQGTASRVFLDFLRVVARHERLDCLRAIYTESVRRYDELGGRIRVQITSAVALAPETVDQITQGLRKKFGDKELLVSCKVDPATIGGLVVRVGDRIYDGSIATQLENIRRNIVQNYVPGT